MLRTTRSLRVAVRSKNCRTDFAQTAVSMLGKTLRIFFLPAKLSSVLEGHQVASALRKADKHRLMLTQRGLHQI